MLSDETARRPAHRSRSAALRLSVAVASPPAAGGGGGGGGGDGGGGCEAAARPPLFIRVAALPLDVLLEQVASEGERGERDSGCLQAGREERCGGR